MRRLRRRERAPIGIGLADIEGRATSDTYRLRHRDGRTVWVRDDAMVLRDSDGHAMFHGVLVDATQEKQLG